MNKNNTNPIEKIVNSKTESLKTYALIGIGGLVLIFAGNQIEGDAHHFSTFLIEVGMAFIIALIVIFTIEQNQRNHQNKFIETTIQGISTHLFNTAYKKLIPDHVFNEFVDCLTSTNVTRTNHSIEYQLNKFEDPAIDKYLLCTGISTYTLENIASKEIEQSIDFYIEVPLDKNMSSYCKFETIKIGDVAISESELLNCITKTDDSLFFSKKITLKQGEKVNIFTKACMVKYTVDTENWELIYPSDGVSMRLQCDRSLDLKLCAKSRHSKKLNLVIDENCNKLWTLEGGTFPHQSICLWWYKNK